MEKIIDYVLDEYLSNISDAVEFSFKKWINKCRNGNVDSKRLLYCIAIDTKFKLVDKLQYVNIFNEMDYSSKLKPQLIFENAINKNNGQLHCFSRYNKKRIKLNSIYCSAIKLSTFVKHYARKPSKTKSHNMDDEIDIVKDELMNGAYKSFNIPYNSGKKQREVSWVALHGEVDAILKLAKENDLNEADYLCERLGLYRDHMGTIEDPLPEYIILVYPEKMYEKFYQPISINADWKSDKGLYLSYKNENYFGRTRNLTSGDLTLSLNERVHHKINKEYTYSASYIEKTKSGKRNLITMLNDAKLRFNS